MVRCTVNILLALVPWAISLYLHYWFEHGGVWQVDMAFRTLISGVLLAAGMAGSFFFYSRLAQLQGRKKPDA
jgi:hypothetical protein